MRVAISGSTGFLGSELARVFRESGLEVFAVPRMASFEESFKIHGDDAMFQFEELINHLNPDYVIHCATHFSTSSALSTIQKVFEANLEFSTYLFEASLRRQIPFMNFSSYWQFANNSMRSSPYAASKSAFLTYVDQRLRNHPDFLFTNLVVPETFGPSDGRDKLIPRAIRAFQSGVDFFPREPKALLDFSCSTHLASYCLQHVTQSSKLARGTSSMYYSNFMSVEVQGLIDFIRQLSGDFDSDSTIRFLADSGPFGGTYPGLKSIDRFGQLSQETLHSCIEAAVRSVPHEVDSDSILVKESNEDDQ